MAKDKKVEKKTKIPNSIKRFKQSEKRRLLNKVFKSRVRTTIKAFEAVLSGQDAAAKSERLNEIYSLMDQGVKKGVYKVNKASRTKARMAARVAAA